MDTKLIDLVAILGLSARLLLAEAERANNEELARVADAVLQALKTLQSSSDEDHEVG